MTDFGTQHYKKGSIYPTLEEGTQRVYSMRFCPYAQRARMVLLHKNIPHEIINIDLRKKPDWFLQKNPLGLVPVLEKDDKIVHDSKICMYYLDEVYPDNKMLPEDPYEKAKIAMLMEIFSKVTTAFFGVLMNINNDEKREENITYFKTALKPFEDALGNQPFFGGDNIGMLDIFLWPFSERLGVIEELTKKQILTTETGFPKYRQWIEEMKNTELVKSVMLSTNVHLKYFQTHVSGTGDYDDITVD